MMRNMMMVLVIVATFSGCATAQPIATPVLAPAIASDEVSDSVKDAALAVAIKVPVMGKLLEELEEYVANSRTATGDCVQSAKLEPETGASVLDACLEKVGEVYSQLMDVYIYKMLVELQVELQNEKNARRAGPDGDPDAEHRKERLAIAGRIAVAMWNVAKELNPMVVGHGRFTDTSSYPELRMEENERVIRAIQAERLMMRHMLALTKQ